MVKDWFGIVAQGLPEEDARAFHVGLLSRGIASDVVADSEIPALPQDFRCQRIDLHGDSITLTTAMNRRQMRDRTELVFVSAGKVIRDKTSRSSFAEPTRNYNGGGGYEPPVRVTTVEAVPTEFFRIDFFFSSDPHRVSLEIEKDTVLFHGDRPLRLKNIMELTVLMLDLQALIPPERMNRSLRELSMETFYPTMHAYEEEMRWEFFRLGAKG